MYRYHIDLCKIATTKLNDVAILASCCVSFFYGSGLSRFQGKQMGVLTTATLAASLRPFLTGMKVLEDFHSINIFIRSTMLFKSWIIMLFIKSLIVFCVLPLVLLLFILHMSSVYIYTKARVTIKT
jgi:hypothetical protein